MGIPSLVLLFFMLTYARSRDCRTRTSRRGFGKLVELKTLSLFCGGVLWFGLVWKLVRQPVLAELFRVVTDLIPEEMFPSDHLFLSVAVDYVS